MFEGTDIVVDPEDLKSTDEPATNDTAERTDDDTSMGGTGGQNAGGAG